MGFNTTVVFNNDLVHAMDDDPQIGRKIHEATLTVYRDEPSSVHCGGGTVATAIETHHADVAAIVAVGNNGAVVLGHTAWCGNDEDAKLKFLKRLADQMGYYVSKKPSRK